MKRPTFIDGLPDEATAAKALAHPLRRLVLDELHARGPLSPRNLSEILDVEIQKVNHHVQTLKSARFVALHQEVRRRGVIEHVYRAHLQARVEVWAPGELERAVG